MHSRLLSHAFIHTLILLLIILLSYSRAYQFVNIHSFIPGFSVIHSSTHSFFYSLILLIHSLAYKPCNIQSCIPGFSVMHSSQHSSTHYSTHSFTCIPASQYPVLHSRLLSHTFIHTFILLLIHSRTYAIHPIPSHVFQAFQSCIYLHIHYFFSFIHVHIHSNTHYSTHSINY
jgi:hypothetical protein